jgi:hypothetical protein
MIVWNLFLVGKLFVLIWGLGKFFFKKRFFQDFKSISSRRFHH